MHYYKREERRGERQMKRERLGEREKWDDGDEVGVRDGVRNAVIL